MAAAIIQSQSSSKSMTVEEVTFALQTTYKALQDLQADEAKFATEGAPVERSGSAPDISPDKSIQKNKIVCLECGQEFRMLSPKHLKSHGLTGREYRIKHGFSLRQPLCAKALSERRKKAGKARGLPDNLKKAIANRKKSGLKKPRKKK
jgi:predicted transcriptional regulator